MLNVCREDGSTLIYQFLWDDCHLDVRLGHANVIPNDKKDENYHLMRKYLHSNPIFINSKNKKCKW